MLEGIRIIDFSKYLPGPFATQRLADRGAEVITVEPLAGEPSRHLGEMKDGTGIIYLANNRNKKSVAINLKAAEGVSLAKELIKTADVIIESFRPGVMKRLGLGYEDICSFHPTIIYCSISGYGQENSLNHLGSHDINYMAISGVLAQFKDQNGKPVHPTVQLADHVGGMAASEAIISALVQKERKQIGAYLDLSLVEPLVSMMGTNVLINEAAGHSTGVQSLAGKVVCYQLYETSDCRYVSLGALEPKFWENFCSAVEKEHWVDFGFSEARQGQKVYEEVKQLFKSKTLADWTNFAEKVDCCLAPVLEVGEINSHPAVREKNLLLQLENGTTQTASFTPYSSKQTSPPAIGQHSKELFVESTILTEEMFDHLLNKGVIK